MITRFLGMAFATFACVATASAQETVSIPFAPPTPSAYVIDEVRTMTIQRDQVTKVSTGAIADMHGQSDGEDVFAMHSELRVTPQ